jgi:hypothetical protein
LFDELYQMNSWNSLMIFLQIKFRFKKLLFEVHRDVTVKLIYKNDKEKVCKKDKPIHRLGVSKLRVSHS